jgi:hypothetical protein
MLLRDTYVYASRYVAHIERNKDSKSIPEGFFIYMKDLVCVFL